MEAYVLLIFIVTVVILLQENTKWLNVKWAGGACNISYLILYMVFVLFYSVREGIGYDYGMYRGSISGGYAYDVYAPNGEIISASLMDFASYCENYHIYFALVAAISFFLIIRSLHDNFAREKVWIWGILVFMALPIGFMESLSIQRQFLAMSVLMYGIKYIFKGCLYKYLLTVIIATMCHVSSASFLILYAVRFVKVKTILIIGMLLTILTNFVLNLLADYFIQIQRYLQMVNADSAGGWGQYIFYMLMLCMAAFFRRYVRGAEYDIKFKIYFFGIIAIQMFMNIDLKVAFRLGGVALYTLMLIIPDCIKCFKSSQRIFIKLIVYAVLVGMFIYNLHISSGDYYVPFKTWL